MPSFTLKSFLVGAGAVSVLAAPSKLGRRDASTISQDIKYVNGNLTAVTESTNKYNGGLIQALPLTGTESDLESSIKQASLGAQASDQIDSENTKAIISYINTQLQPNIGKVLSALSAKKDQFTKVKLNSKVADDVATLHKLTDNLGASLISVASDDQKDAGKQALAKIDADFAQAAQTWGASDAGAGSARMVRRDAVTISNDMKAVSGNLSSLTETVNSWKGGLIQALPITRSESSLERSIKEASVGAKSSDQVDSQNTKKIISFINTNLEPNIGKVLSALAAKKSQFADAHLTKTVSDDVATLHKLTDSLAATLVEKASNDQKEAAKQAVAKIDGDFAQATQTWGASTASAN